MATVVTQISDRKIIVNAITVVLDMNNEWVASGELTTYEKQYFEQHLKANNLLK
jgi:hypothetical protein